ncbi:MAG: hypothetical protein IJR45_02125 [Firmicutes bacterium]|nr:hypothetical protein [Bacillota bacterium]MBQ9604188.1 hypothetical protein [Bacillota bacterium]
MNISYVEGSCPNCGAKTKESCNTWVYGSPIRTCKSCNAEYIDKRWREVAIDGFDPRSQNADFYLKGTLGLAVFTIVCILLTVWMAGTSGRIPLKMIACIIGGALGTVFCAYRLIKIKSGAVEKENAAFMEESINRLKNADYVKKLEEYGYKIPEEFKK